MQLKEKVIGKKQKSDDETMGVKGKLSLETKAETLCSEERVKEDWEDSREMKKLLDKFKGWSERSLDKILEAMERLRLLNLPPTEAPKINPQHISSSKSTKSCLESVFSKRLFCDLDENKPLLVMDLDETMVSVHSIPSVSCISLPPSHSNEFIIPLAEETLHVIKRPFLDRFLLEIKKYFNICCFTSAQKEYADRILERIDPEHKIFSYRLYRTDCRIVPFKCREGKGLGNKLKGTLIKDLRTLREIKELSQIVIVDDNFMHFGMQMDNGILVSPFYGSSQDKELLFLLDYLIRLTQYTNIQAANTHNMMFSQLFRFTQNFHI